jgi:uncharacterized protein (TIGR00255 family)
MTGFGSGEGPAGGGVLRVELKSVNHRYLVVTLKAPPELGGLEGEIRDLLRKDFERGHLTVSCRWVETPTASEPLRVNVERARAVASRLRELDLAVGGAGGITLDLIVRQPEVIGGREEAAPAVEWSAVALVIARAIDGCRASRATEGRVLAGELRGRLGAVREQAAVVRARAPERVVAERNRLRAAVASLLDGRPVDEGRLAQEIAFLAEKIDVVEELVRLEAHLAAAEQSLEGGGPIGKHLGFLAQEMGREINTIGSKANDVAMQHAVVEMKGELERFREQLENLE